MTAASSATSARARARLREGQRGLCFVRACEGGEVVLTTYGHYDPVIFLEYAVDLADACHVRGIASNAVTAGHVCEAPRRDFFAHMDAANVDLKSFDEDFYHRVCSGHLRPVLDTLEYLVHETTVWVEITTFLIRGLNDSDAELDALTTWVIERFGPEVPLPFTPSTQTSCSTGRRRRRRP
jgi:pyruvate formate lyase activating enzyme